MYITKDEIRAAVDLPWEDVPVDEWKPGAVQRIRGLDAKSATAFSKNQVKADAKGKLKEVELDENFMPKLITLTAVDENGNLMFSESDVEWLAHKSAKVMKRLVDVSMRLSGLSDNALEDAVKNSTTPQSALPTA